MSMPVVSVRSRCEDHTPLFSPGSSVFSCSVGVDRSLGSGEGARIASLPGRRSLSAYSSDEHPRQDGAACQVTHTINKVQKL